MRANGKWRSESRSGPSLARRSEDLAPHHHLAGAAPEVMGTREGRNLSIPAWLPDWREPTKYPDANTAPLLQWAWEFLRRNADYQTDAVLASRWPAAPGDVPLGSAELLEKLTSADTDHGVSDEERRVWVHWGELQSCQIAKVGDLARKWHLPRGILPDPANANAWNEDNFEIEGHVQHSYGARWLTTGKPSAFMGRPRHPDEIGVFFDLREPLPPQLKAATRLLNHLRREYAARGWIKAARYRGSRRVNLLGYLRVLDAKAVGVPIAEIAGQLHPRLSNEPPNGNGYRRVIDDAEEGQRLIEGGYVRLRIA